MEITKPLGTCNKDYIKWHVKFGKYEILLQTSMYYYMEAKIFVFRKQDVQIDTLQKKVFDIINNFEF